MAEPASSELVREPHQVAGKQRKLQRDCSCKSGCGKQAVKRGMCNGCYQRWRSSTSPEDRRRPTEEERFQSKVERRGPDDCWYWLAGCSDQGYGVFRSADDSVVGAHRMAFKLAHGYLPDTADHTCHNGSGCPGGSACPHRACCNPAHIEDTSSGVNTLRGEGLSAYHARKTHCVNGHEFNLENTYHPPGRPHHRMCRRCTRIRQARYGTKRAA